MIDVCKAFHIYTHFNNLRSLTGDFSKHYQFWKLAVNPLSSHLLLLVYPALLNISCKVKFVIVCWWCVRLWGRDGRQPVRGECGQRAGLGQGGAWFPVGLSPSSSLPHRGVPSSCPLQRPPWPLQRLPQRPPLLGFSAGEHVFLLIVLLVFMLLS